MRHFEPLSEFLQQQKKNQPDECQDLLQRPKHTGAQISGNWFQPKILL